MTGYGGQGEVGKEAMVDLGQLGDHKAVLGRGARVAAVEQPIVWWWTSLAALMTW